MKKLLKIVPIITLLLITIPFSFEQAQAQSQNPIVAFTQIKNLVRVQLNTK